VTASTPEAIGPGELEESPSIIEQPPAAPHVAVRTRQEIPRLAMLSYVAVCVFWGTSGPAIRYSTRYFAPLWMVVLRFAIAGGLLLFGLSLTRGPVRTRGLRRIVPSGLALAASNILVTLGFQRVESGSGTLLLATTAVSFAVTDRLWPGSKSKPNSAVWAGLLLGLLGVAVLVLGHRTTHDSHWSGYIMLAISAWTWALGSVYQSRRPSAFDPLQSSAWQMLIAAGVVLPAAILTKQPFPSSVPLEGWLGIAFLIVTASLIGFVGFVHMLRHVPAYVAGSYTYVNAVVAALTGWLWLGEHLDVRFYVAAALVLSGVALIQLRERQGRAEKP
jgi:drug/metabolite transporter (DMT)-like permease